jgi:hypothetical protein
MAAPKKFHTQAGSDTHSMLQDVIKESHGKLIKSSFLILFKHGGWESKGRTILGRVKVVGDDIRSTFGYDAIIYLNRNAWVMFSPVQKKYLLDHELCHLDVVVDKNFDTKIGEDGRPKLTTNPHDLEDFVAVVKRHGLIMEDMKRLAKVLIESKQITIEEVTAGDEKAEPEETEVIDDENQLTLDQIEAADAEAGDEEVVTSGPKIG